MTELDTSSWTVVSLSDSSAVKFAGDWNVDEPGGFHNISHPETPVSVAYTFHGGVSMHSFRGVSGVAYQHGFCSGTQAGASGFMISDDSRPLYVWITRSSGEPFGRLLIPPSYSNHCVGDPCPPGLFTTEILPCDEYTLNLTVTSDQAVQIKEFDFMPCTSENDQASASASASTTSSPSSAATTAAAKQRTLTTGVIVGAVLGAMLVFALTSLAFFILLRRSRRSRGSQPPSLTSFSRFRHWFRLPGRHPKPIITPAHFPAPPVSLSFSSTAAAAAAASASASHAYPILDVHAAHPGSASAVSATPATTGLAAPTLPWLFDRSSTTYYPRDVGSATTDAQLLHARDGEMAEKQPLRSDDADLDTAAAGLAYTHGYLPDSKDFVAWQEREQAVAARRSPTIEALPLYRSRGSLQCSP